MNNKMKMKSNALIILMLLAMVFIMITAMSVTVYAEEEECAAFSTIVGNGDPFTYYDQIHPYMIFAKSSSTDGIDLSPQGHTARIVRDDESNDLLMITKVECKGYGDFSKFTSSEGTISISKDEVDEEKSIATVTGENGADLDKHNVTLGAAEDAAGSIKITDIKIYYIQYNTYDVWVGDTRVTGRNADDVLAGDPVNAGKVSFVPAQDGKSGILTLSGVDIKNRPEGKYCNIISNDCDLTVVLKGKNLVGDTEIPGNNAGIAIRSNSIYGGNLIIQGEGSLTARGAMHAINVQRTFEIRSGTVDAKGGEEGISTDHLSIVSGKVTASGTKRAISGEVENAIAGAGWTDKEGTQGREDIEVSEEPQDLGRFKNVRFPPEPEPTPEPPTPTPTPTPTKVSGIPTAKMTAGKKSMTISWNKINGAAGYDIFFALCSNGKKEIKCKRVRSIKGNNTFKWTKTGLKKGTSYKAYVKAYVMKNGKKSYVRTSPVMHAYTGNGNRKYTNAKSVTVNKTKVTLKKGKTFRIKAKVIKVNKKKDLMPKSHAPKIRYMSSDSKVATVSSNGKVTAKGKGTCTIVAYAHNGVSKQIRVTVK